MSGCRRPRASRRALYRGRRRARDPRSVRWCGPSLRAATSRRSGLRGVVEPSARQKRRAWGVIQPGSDVVRETATEPSGLCSDASQSPAAWSAGASRPSPRPRVARSARPARAVGSAQAAAPRRYPQPPSRPARSSNSRRAAAVQSSLIIRWALFPTRAVRIEPIVATTSRAIIGYGGGSGVVRDRTPRRIWCRKTTAGRFASQRSCWL